MYIFVRFKQIFMVFLREIFGLLQNTLIKKLKSVVYDFQKFEESTKDLKIYIFL
jgi:hypothetical protein